MGIISTIVSGFTGGLAQPVTQLATTFFGDKSKRDEYDSNENVAGLGEFAAENNVQNNRTWWDSLVDGLNRLMRPSSFFTFLGLMWLAMYNPQKFAIVSSSLALVPAQIWTILGLMIAFLFPSRLLEKGMLNKGVTQSDAQNIVKMAQNVNTLKEQYEDVQTKDEPNNSIVAWLSSKISPNIEPKNGS